MLVLLLIGTACLSITSVYAYETTNDMIKTTLLQKKYDFSITDQKYYFYQDDDIVVFGNHDGLSKSTIDQLINEGYSVFIYDYYLDDNLGNNIFDTNSAVLYSNTKGKHVDILNLGETIFDDFKEEVVSFYDEKISMDTQIETLASTNELFVPLYSGTFREVKKPYGYIDVIYTVKKYRAKNESSLYLVESKASFTPGKMAKDNGDNTYGNWYNHSGFFHVEGTQAVNEIDQATIRKGGIPKFKDAYPENAPGTITVTSSYSIGATLGYSFTNGFSLDNITVSENTSLGLNISYGYNNLTRLQNQRYRLKEVQLTRIFINGNIHIIHIEMKLII